jgi:DNA repair exonuclease SbcCD ATPase subunit
MKKPFLPLVLAASLLALISCNQQPGNSAQVKALEDRIRQLEDQENQLQLKTEQDKLAADRAALEAEKQKLEERQNAIAQPTDKPETPTFESSYRAPSKSSDYQDDSDLRAIRDSGADSYNVFYNRLQPEGRWLEDDTYGYVWQPNAAMHDDNWRPYTDGHWAYTDRGWTWISNENFGWATYHYGRWTRIRDVGWIWVPGNTWAPAWVSWRQSDHEDYVGWAPLPPECDPSPNVKVEAWVDNYYDIGPAAYVFLKAVDFARPSYREAILPPQQNVTIINQTKNVTNITYNNNVINSFGPQYQQLAKVTNNRLERYRINYQQQIQPNANFKTVVAGNQLQVVAPPAQLKRQATIQPQGVRQMQKSQFERGWQNIDAAQAQQIKQAFQQTAPPVPKGLPPQPTPPPKAIFAAAPIQKPGQPPAGVGQLQKPGTPPNNNQIAGERAKIEAEKAQLEQQRQALLTGQKPGIQPPQPQQAEQQQKDQALKQQQQAEADRARQLEAQKAQQAEQARLQQEAQNKLQAEQQQKDLALKQQQQAEADRARQLEAQKAQQAEQARLQQEAQNKLQAEQQQKDLALKQQQQAEADRARQLEAQKAQQAEQARLQQETQHKLQAEQQQREQALRQQQGAGNKAKQTEAQKLQEEKKKKEEKNPQPNQPQ